MVAGGGGFKSGFMAIMTIFSLSLAVIKSQSCESRYVFYIYISIYISFVKLLYSTARKLINEA